jgi:uncharacterized cupin superfamily protein
MCRNGGHTVLQNRPAWGKNRRKREMKKIKKKRMTRDEVDKRGISSWGVWEKEPSEFDWEYTSEEHCYIIEGKAVVSSDDGIVAIEEGDYVIFPAGLKCRWDVQKPLRKYYEFR